MSSEPPPKPIGPGNHDRAWNDPPLFSVAVNTTAKAPARKLTARVGFPINGTVGTAQMPTGNSGPPMPMNIPPPFGPPHVSPQPVAQFLPIGTHNSAVPDDTLLQSSVTVPS